MKKHTALMLIIVAILGLAFCGAAQAANATWDITPGTVGAGNSAVTGGAGTWNTINGNWTIDSGVNNIAWVNGNNDTAVFGGTAGTVTLGEGITVGGLTFNIATYTVTNNTLTFGSAGIISNAVAATIASALAGPGAITKNGAGTLTLSGANTYSGGTVINSGILTVTADTHLGNASGGITLNGGRLYANNVPGARIITVNGTGSSIFVNRNNSYTTTGKLTGAGELTLPGSAPSGTASIYNFNSTANDFTGTLLSSSAVTLNFNSFSDGAGNIVFNADSNGGGVFNYGASAVAGMSLSTRAIEINSAVSAVVTIQNNNTTHAINISTDLVATGAGAKTLTLGATAGPVNVFAGNISNGTGGGTVALTKSGAGTWSLSGTNTYSGKTAVGTGFPVASTLIFQGKQAVSPNTTFETSQSAGATTKLVFLDDSAGIISLNNSWTFRVNGDGQKDTAIFVGNNSTANGGNNPGSTQTGSTIALGGYISFPNNIAGATTDYEKVNITGANGYKLQLASIAFPDISTKAAASLFTILINPTTAPLIVAGGVTSFASANANSTPVIQLDGTAVGNEIMGTISNPANVPTSNPLNVTKSSTSEWTLSGANTYTGATSINGGALRFATGSGSRCASAVTIANTAGCLFGVNLAAANGQWASSSSLTVAGTNSAIEVDYGSTAPSTTVDPIQVTSLTVSTVGTLRILSSDLSQFVVGNTYPLINGTTSVPANADPYTGLTLVLPTGVTGKLVTVDNHVNLVITGNTAKSWNSGDANWDTGSPWTVAGTPAAFVANDTVYLGDSPGVSGNPTINVSGASVSPTAVIMNSTSHDYTIAGNSIDAGTVTVNTLSRTLTLSSANTYTGATTITKGTLRAGVASIPGTSGAFGNTSPVTLANDSTAVLDLNGYNNTIASLSGGGGNVVLGSATLTTGGNNASTTYAGLISGSGGLTKAGSGTLTLTGVNTYSGNTTISAGTLRIGNNTAGTLGAGNYAGNIVNNGTLQIWSTAAQTLSGVISGSGDLQKAYGGSLTLSGANTYSGRSIFVPQSTAGFTVNVSSFNSVNGGTPLLASSSLGAPTNAANGTIDVGGTAQAGVTLNYTGPGETTDRILKVAWNGNSSQTISVSGSGLLKFTSPFTLTPSGGTGSLVLTGTGNGEIVQGLTAMQSTGLSKTGSGTWTLSGVNTYDKPTTVSAGTLNLNAANAIVAGSSPIAVSGGTLNLNATNAISTRPVTISGTGRVNANAPYALGSCAITVTNSATLALTVDLSLMSTNSLTIAGTGKVQLDTNVKATAGSLFFGTNSQAAGVWGSTNSAAEYKSTNFTGTGKLYVNVDFPSDGTVIIVR